MLDLRARNRSLDGSDVLDLFAGQIGHLAGSGLRLAGGRAATLQIAKAPGQGSTAQAVRGLAAVPLHRHLVYLEKPGRRGAE